MTLGFGFAIRARRPAAAAAPALTALGGGFALAETAVQGAVAGTVTGKTAASVLSLVDDAGGRVALSGNQIVRGATSLDYETATRHTFTVRETLAGAANSPRDSVLTLSVVDADEIPDGFAFAPVSNAVASSIQTSASIAVTGMAAGAVTAVVVSGGSYSKNGGAYTTSPGTAQNGDTFTLRHTANATAAGTMTTTLTIGGVAGSFTSTTETLLAALTGTFSLSELAAANALAGSISGKTAGSVLSLVDDAGGRVALSGSTIVRGATALDYETATSHSFTVRETLAGASNSPRDTVFTLTVVDADEVPDAFAFADVTGVATNAVQTSNTITVAGMASGASAAVTISGGTYSKNGGAYTSAAGTAQNGDTFAVRHTASASASTAVNTVLTIGGISDTFTSTTAAAALLSAGLTYTWIGDGLQAPGGGVGSGTTNAAHQFDRMHNGRLQPTPFPVIANSGTTIARDISTNRAYIKPYAIDAAAAQVPEVFIFGTCGANDNLLSTNPGTNAGNGQTTNVYLQDWYDAVTYAYGKFTAYGGKLFVVMPTLPSTKAGEATYRAQVWTAQKAFIAGLTASDPKVLLADITDMTDPTQWSSDSSSSYTHPDERGAYRMALAVFSAIDAKIQAKTADEIRDMIAAGTYPLQGAAQTDTDEALTGTAGTVTGPGIGGYIATSKAITNTTGATGISVAQVATSGGRTKTVVTLAGTTSAAGKIMVQDKNNYTATGATPGQQFRTGAIVRASAGYRNFGGDWANSYGYWGGSAVSLVNNTMAGANETHALDALIINGSLNGSSPSMTRGAPTFQGKRSYALFYPSGVTLSGTIEMERPFAYIPSNRTAAAPAYIGDTQNSLGTTQLGSNYRLRPSGTVTNAAGGTVTIEPGVWNLFGLTQTDFAARRLYAGGGSGGADNKQNLGLGTLLATLSGSTWTYTVGAGALTAGTILYVEVDCNNGVGPTVTYRSAQSLTVT